MAADGAAVELMEAAIAGVVVEEARIALAGEMAALLLWQWKWWKRQCWSNG